MSNQESKYSVDPELTGRQVKTISSFFRSEAYCRGYGTRTSMDEIARVAYLHWCDFNKIKAELDHLRSDFQAISLNYHESICDRSNLREENSKHKFLIRKLIAQCLELHKEVGHEITEEELLTELESK